MKKLLQNKRGMTLVTVVIIMTVLVLLCAVLAEIVVQTLVISKRHRNIDYAYYAGESAIEKWADVVSTHIVNKTDIGNGYTGTLNLSNENSRKQYAEYIINNKVASITFDNQDIDIEGKGTNLAEVKFIGIEFVDTKWNSASMGSNFMEILIGFKANSSYSSTSAYKAGNKHVYAVKSFKVSCPVKNGLEGAIYAVGDFYVNDSTVKVKGDVFTFGSYGGKTTSLNQSYFGGIFAINKAQLNIYGNAYSRSFIRTGPYRPYGTQGNDLPDSSRIVVYKDAIAESIQSFGNNDETVVLGNAYTFDDIEVNGLNSIIAINGSFIGLSKGGDEKNHDQSSAIVNSARIHQQMQPGSEKSKIAINGDVLIPGTTMKTDDNGKTIGRIEAASVAYHDVLGIPFYKWWPYWEIKNDVKYHEELRSSKDEIKGKINQIQVHDMLKPFDDPGFDESKINLWLDNIRYDRVKALPLNYNLKGIAVNEVAANDTLYMAYLDPDNTEDEFDINFYIGQTNSTPIGDYRLDNIFDDDGKIRYDKGYWNVTSYSDLYGLETEYGLVGKCGEIHRDLLGKVQRFAARSFSNTQWVFEKKSDFNEILKALNVKSAAYRRPEIVYLDKDHTYSGPGVPDIKDFFSFDVYAESSMSRSGGFASDGRYFIFINANMNLPIKISGTFNGLIVTAGKVILDDGASVYGSIIAAGDGEYDGDIFYPQSKAVANESDEKKLEDGDYAAIKAVGTSSVPYVDFFLGLTGGPDAPFKKDQMVNVLNAAAETVEGKVLLNDYIDSATGKIDNNKVDEALAYLNKAARINLLEKFNQEGIYLYDIF